MAQHISSTVARRGRRVAGGIVRRLKRARQKLVRLDQSKVLKALDAFGPVQGDILMVHSSLSACGYLSDGPATVLAALRTWLSDRRALAMPTHTWSYPDETGVAPVYDFQATPSVVGAITNYFWRQPNVVRSLHPSHSLAYSGPDAEAFCRGHELCETPCGRGTPYAKLVERNASVLMFGATLDSYTLFHTAEDAAQLPYLYQPEQLRLRSKDKDGTLRSIPVWRQDMGVGRRFAALTPWLETQGLLLRRPLGLGELLFIPRAGDLHEQVVAELRRDPLLLVAESARAEVAKRFNL